MLEFKPICEVASGALVESMGKTVCLYTCPICFGAVQDRNIPDHMSWHIGIKGYGMVTSDSYISPPDCDQNS